MEDRSFAPHVKNSFGEINPSMDMLEYLWAERKIPSSIAKFFRLEWDGMGIRIPVENWVKRYNIQSYDPISHRVDHGLRGKMEWVVKQESVLPPFPSFADLSQGQVIVEGEFDCMCAIAHGVLAVSSSAGAGAWLPEWTKAVVGMPYTILYDNDEEGYKGSLKVAGLLREAGSTVKIAKWPADRPHKWDVTDHFRSGGTVEQLQEIIESATEFTVHTPIRKGRILGGIEL